MAGYMNRVPKRKPILQSGVGGGYGGVVPNQHGLGPGPGPQRFGYHGDVIQHTVNPNWKPPPGRPHFVGDPIFSRPGQSGRTGGGYGPKGVPFKFPPRSSYGGGGTGGTSLLGGGGRGGNYATGGIGVRGGLPGVIHEIAQGHSAVGYSKPRTGGEGPGVNPQVHKLAGRFGNQLARRIVAGKISHSQAEHTLGQRQALESKFGSGWRKTVFGGTDVGHLRHQLANYPATGGPEKLGGLRDTYAKLLTRRRKYLAKAGWQKTSMPPPA